MSVDIGGSVYDDLFRLLKLKDGHSLFRVEFDNQLLLNVLRNHVT